MRAGMGGIQLAQRNESRDGRNTVGTATWQQRWEEYGWHSKMRAAMRPASSVTVQCQCFPPQGERSSDKNHPSACDPMAMKMASTGIRWGKMWAVWLGMHHNVSDMVTEHRRTKYSLKETFLISTHQHCFTYMIVVVGDQGPEPRLWLHCRH
jgi:hypothetical protein